MTVNTWCFPAIAFLTTALTAGPAWGETERVLRFAHVDDVQNMNEITGSIRTLTDAAASIDKTEKSVKVAGSPDQLALAEWLFNQFDVPPSSTPSAAVHQYVMKGEGENTARVFYLPNTATVQAFQECAAAIRAITEIRRSFAYNAPRAIAVRGTPETVELAAWMVDVMNTPAGEKAASREYRLPMSSDKFGEVVTRVLYVENAATARDFQDTAAAIRTIGLIRRTFTNNTFTDNRPRMIFVRSDAEAVAMADWLVQQLDKPAAKPGAVAERSSERYNYVSHSNDAALAAGNTVRVYYLAAMTVQDFQAFAGRIGSATQARMMYVCSSAGAIAVRGTINQIETADRMVKELGSSR